MDKSIFSIAYYSYMANDCSIDLKIEHDTET